MTRTVIVGVLTFLIGSASVVIATGGIPGTDGRIYACYNQTNGNVRIVTGPSDCRNADISIWWNQTGPAGAAGPAGVAGATGATGAAGSSGATGPGITETTLGCPNGN